jgi:predicted ATP-binding protein involved in virulence
MKLDKISFANFKGFEQLDLDFESDVTVLAGINGIGKSSILYAIAVVLSKALPFFTASTSKPRSFDTDDIYSKGDVLKTNTNFLVTMQLSIESQLLDLGVQKEIFSEFLDSTERFILLHRNDEQPKQQDLKQALQSRTMTGDLEAGILETIAILASLKKDKNQPIAIYFSPKRQLPGRPRSLPSQKPFNIAQAYSFALDDREIELREFLDWFRTQEKLGSSQRILDSLRSVITEFIPAFTNLRLREQPKLAFLVEKDGKPFELHQLSDGERGLLAIVFDLTRRLAIANPESSNPISEGIALVMIDEIELHLHPTWQRQVLRRLTSTFKNCQFIVTTHSPQVIGQTRAEKLRLLYTGDKGKIRAITPNQALGMDSSWILQNIMGSSARDYETEQKLGAIFDAIDNDDYPSARQGIAQLLETVGNFPDLQEASSLLDRLELLEKYEED